jgi:hypothetical protein
MIKQQIFDPSSFDAVMIGCAEMEFAIRSSAPIDSQAGDSLVPVDEVARDCSTSGCTGPAEVAGIIPTMGTPLSRPKSPLGPNHLTFAFSAKTTVLVEPRRSFFRR